MLYLHKIDVQQFNFASRVYSEVVNNMLSKRRRPKEAAFLADAAIVCVYAV